MAKEGSIRMDQKYILHHKSCYGLDGIGPDSVDAVVTDPPYGISFQNNYWDKDLPAPQIWGDCLRVLKPGGFALIFSSVRLLHRMMVSVEDAGFVIKDILFWSFLNGMPKSKNIALNIDKELGVESKVVGKYTYVQGYRKGGTGDYKAKAEKYIKEPESPEGRRYNGAGMGVKPAYEPVIMVQKPLAEGLSLTQNILKYGTGALNLEETRIPYGEEGSKVGHNPHPKGRVASNIIRTAPFNDGYDKFFLVPKVRQHAEKYNDHPTLKPLHLMEHLVKLVSFEEQMILDPFMGSGSTGIAAIRNNRKFTGYELEERYYKITEQRFRENL